MYPSCSVSPPAALDQRVTLSVPDSFTQLHFINQQKAGEETFNLNLFFHLLSDQLHLSEDYATIQSTFRWGGGGGGGNESCGTFGQSGLELWKDSRVGQDGKTEAVKAYLKL